MYVCSRLEIMGGRAILLSKMVKHLSKRAVNLHVCLR